MEIHYCTRVCSLIGHEVDDFVLILTIDETAWVAEHVGIDIKKWRYAKKCIKLYIHFRDHLKRPLHYNQYVALSSAGDDEIALTNIAYDLEWDWEKATSKVIMEAVKYRMNPTETYAEQTEDEPQTEH
jgi:hypothetical protein